MPPHCRSFVSVWWRLHHFLTSWRWERTKEDRQTDAPPCWLTELSDFVRHLLMKTLWNLQFCCNSTTWCALVVSPVRLLVGVLPPFSPVSEPRLEWNGGLFSLDPDVAPCMSTQDNMSWVWRWADDITGHITLKYEQYTTHTDKKRSRTKLEHNFLNATPKNEFNWFIIDYSD